MSTIYITKNDYKKLNDLIEKKFPHDDYDNALFLELKKAKIIEPKNIPSDVITMNSLVNFIDVESNSDLKYWLVFPQEADVKQGKISVLSPIGCALLGYRIGDVISLKTPGGERKIKVEKIMHQPESEGNYD